MRRRKILLTVAGLGIVLSMGTVGCGKDAANIEKPVRIQDTSLEDAEDADSSTEDGKRSAEKAEEEENNDRANEENSEKGLAEETPEQARKEPLSGKIQQIDADGMTIAQTTVWADREGGSSEIILVDEKDAEKISVRFAKDVKVQYWRIEGGGADIDMQDRTLSDLAVGQMVEMEGYYEGDEYVATKILMEEYVQGKNEDSKQTTAGTEELTGSVRSVGADSFVVSKSTTEHYDGYDIEVGAAPGSEEEELVTVYVTDSAVCQYVTAKNSGINPEDITAREGSYSDMKEGLSVTLKGYWENGSFYADNLKMTEFIR